MLFFNRKINKKHIEQLELKITSLLKSDFPQFEEVLNLSKNYGISSSREPLSIYISRGYTPENYELIIRKYRTSFNLNGIEVFNKKTEKFEPIFLYYQNYSLTNIETDNPEFFHKDYDLEQLRKTKIEFEHLTINNPDKEIVEKILKSLTNEQIELLELDDTFEIDFEGKIFYTILDMEDGNYIAIDKNGKIYRLHHDHMERIKLIAENPTEFFKIYNEKKIDLEEIMTE